MISICSRGAAPAASASATRAATDPRNHSQRGSEPTGYSTNGNNGASHAQASAPAAAPSGRPQYAGDERVRLSGRIGRYFEVKQIASGTWLAVFSIATSQPHRDQSGNWQKQTVWQRIVVWGETAEALADQIEKGARVQVEGKYKTRDWTDRDNNLRTTRELVARNVQFLDLAENRMAA